MAWTESKPNAPDAARPYALVMGKEESGTLEKIIPVFEQQFRQLEEGFSLMHNGKQITIKVRTESSMYDGKMRKLLLGTWRRILRALHFATSLMLPLMTKT